jgi:hypothetical protein
VTLTTPVWPTGSVSDALDIQVQTDAARSVLDVDTLVGIALRHNPKRAHLLVSTVLAKHVPTVPGIALAAGELLGLLVSAAITDSREPSLDGAGGANLMHEFGDRLTALVGRLTEETGAATPGEAPSARRDLTALRRDIRTATTPHPDVVTLGYAETATGLGQLVADALTAYYLHSTRHARRSTPTPPTTPCCRRTQSGCGTAAPRFWWTTNSVPAPP